LKRVLPLLSFSAFFGLWHLLVLAFDAKLVPSPLAVIRGLLELLERGLLLRYIVASLYRVTWGYLLAALVAIPTGVLLGLFPRLGLSMNPLIQIFRPISPLAWTPIAILWFGVGDISAIFLIFLAAFFPLVVTSMNAVRNLDEVHWNAGRNFGLSQTEILNKVVYPAIMPQIIVGLRITLGVAWLVVVAAEMIAVNSGLGFLIIDARNAGNRYDLVVAGMMTIGLIGIALDALIRQLERLPSVRWGYAQEPQG
jgi:NitT/TauT family transport system permease protein